MDDKSHKFAGELLEWIKSILRDLGMETGRVDEMEGIISERSIRLRKC